MLLLVLGLFGWAGACSVPCCGVRRFGVWASIRYAPEGSGGGMERYGYSGSAGLNHLCRPAPRVGSCRWASSQPMLCPNRVMPPPC